MKYDEDRELEAQELEQAVGGQKLHKVDRAIEEGGGPVQPDLRARKLRRYKGLFGMM